MSSSDVGGELRGGEQLVQALASADETRLAGRGELVDPVPDLPPKPEWLAERIGGCPED